MLHKFLSAYENLMLILTEGLQDLEFQLANYFWKLYIITSCIQEAMSYLSAWFHIKKDQNFFFFSFSWRITHIIES